MQFDQVNECQLIQLHYFLGKKWSIPLLHNIGTVPITFNELYAIAQRLISPILLSQRLKELLFLGIIKKEVINQRTSYIITEQGNDLKKILHQLKKWSIDNGYNLPKRCMNNICICGEMFRDQEKET